MKPIKFKECNITFAKSQKQYLSLPAYRTNTGDVTTHWKLSWKERIKVLIKGKIYLQILTFNKSLQPVKILTEKPKL